MPNNAYYPRPSAGLIATGLVAASLTAAGLFATALLAANVARAAEPYDPTCNVESEYGQSNPLIVTGFRQRCRPRRPGGRYPHLREHPADRNDHLRRRPGRQTRSRGPERSACHEPRPRRCRAPDRRRD